MTPREKAILLIQCIRNALQNGVKHHNRAGVELTNAKDILECLVNEGQVTIEKPEKPQ